MEFLLPLLIIGMLVITPIAFLLARKGRGSGPHPDDLPGQKE